MINGNERGVELRVDPQSGTIASQLVASQDIHTRFVGPGLIDPGQRNPEFLLLLDENGLVWQDNLYSIFPLADASSDWAYNFDLDRSAGVFVGSVGWPPNVLPGNVWVFQFARTMTAGLSITDGHAIWHDTGTTYACNTLPCPGQPLDTVSRPISPKGPTVALRLRSSGTRTEHPDGTSRVSADEQVTLEGFNPATGQTLWTFEAGHNPGLATTAQLPAQDGLTTLLLRNAAGKLMRLDLRTGQRATVPPVSTGWCRIATLYEQNVGLIPRGGTTAHHFYVTQYLLYPCTAARQPTRPPKRIPPFIAKIGARWHNLGIWASIGRVEAAPIAR
jgi:hypothetical protein